MILLSLEKTEEADVILVLLKTIKKILLTKNEDIEKQLDCYIPRILKFTLFDQSMVINTKFLRYLYLKINLFSDCTNRSFTMLE